MIPAQIRIFVCRAPMDLRRSFDGLAASARHVLGEDPQSGALFVFVNKRKNRLKALWWDQTGYCLLYKRLHRALFVLPDDGAGGISVRVDGSELAALVAGERLERRSSEKAA